MTLRISTVLVAMVAFAAANPAAADSLSELDDAVARIQYGFYTADIRAIEAAIALIERLELPATRRGFKEYHLAYGQWKLAELQSATAEAGQRNARSNAVKAAKLCEAAADFAIRSNAHAAESHAIGAICGELASRTANVLARGCANDKGLRAAREIDPHNVRVRLIEAQCQRAHAKTAAALTSKLEQLVRDFDSSPSRSPGAPDWGHPEALLLLGQLQLEQGNSMAARDTLERALVLAPDYEGARQALQQAAQGSR